MLKNILVTFDLGWDLAILKHIKIFIEYDFSWIIEIGR